MKELLARFIREENGQDLIEYALLGSFVSLAAYTGASFLATKYNGWFSAVGDAVGKASDKTGAEIK